jgi:hypothetical protein
MDAGFRVEYYIKSGIVLLGATLPFTLILWAGPLAMLQATIVSVVTFAVIYYASRALGLDRRLCACLGAGGAICGVSGAIAMAGAVKATKEQVAIAITLVILWAIVMIFVLPFVSQALQLHAAVAGAWIGNSEFADAAGLAAAQTYGGMAEASAGAIQGTAEQALASFTLMKVIGRDIWIGIWAFIFALIATTRWEAEETGARPSAAEIWWRFPKFVIGFLIASESGTWSRRSRICEAGPSSSASSPSGLPRVSVSLLPWARVPSWASPRASPSMWCSAFCCRRSCSRAIGRASWRRRRSNAGYSPSALRAFAVIDWRVEKNASHGSRFMALSRAGSVLAV